EAWPEIDLTAAAEAGNGTGAQGDAADPWGAAAHELGIEEIDPAARLAFLSGDATATPPAAEPAWPAETLPEPLADAPTSPAQPAAAEAAPAATGWSDTFFRDARATEPSPFEPLAPAAPREATADEVAPEPVVAEAAAAPAPADLGAPEPAAPIGESLAPTVEGRAEAGATRTSDLLRRFRPGQSLDAELAAFEAELERQEAAAAGAGETPSADVEPVAAAPVADAAPERVAAVGEPVSEVVPVVPEPAPESVAAVAEPEPVGAVAEPEPVAAVAQPEPQPVTAVAEPEAVVAEAAPAPEPEPVTAAPAPEPEPEPVAAAPEPEPEPLAATPEPATPEPVREDRIEQPTWRIYAPDATQPGPAQPPAPVPTIPTAPPNGNGMPQWPVRPDQVDSPAMALLANRGNGGANADLWAASTREVLAQPAPGMRPGQATGVQPCTNCGLSLSATARFCRRCGTRQG
ncbi:MAG TPA: zinc ribbon domain-containing protein, partial [Candidatus Limnocylindrales bacterium]|nr:zinc ribbon domain-containing protein [Candidatus Limnocylindrales bacterium]